MKTSTTSVKKDWWMKLGVAAIWLLLWQGAYMAVGEDLLLVSPLSVFQRILGLIQDRDFWGILFHSLSHILLGFSLGVLLGSVIAVFTARSRLLYAFFYLPMGIIKATPVASFVILALVWISGRNLSVFISFLMVLPLMWSNVHQGIVQTDPKLLEMAKVYRLKPFAVARSIYLPSVMPYFLTALKVSLGFAWKAGIAGEVLAIPSKTIGTELYNAKIYLETVDLFAWTAVVILLSIFFEKVVVFLVSALAKDLSRYQRGEKDL